MQCIRLNTRAIVSAYRVKLRGFEVPFHDLPEQAKSAGILRIHFYHDSQDSDRGFRAAYGEPREASSAIGYRWTGWKLGAAWAGVFAVSWALVLACVVLAHAP